MSFAQAAAAPRSPKELLPWARLFWQHPNAWLLTVWTLLPLGFRLTLGPPTWGEGLAALVFLSIRPISEWLIHTYILHWRPRKVLGFTIDPLVSSEHRRHHADPRDIPLSFIPGRVLLETVLGITALTFFFAINLEHAATVLTVIAAQFLAYEWIHYLVHTPYRPRSAWFRGINQHHRLHHYRNERYWMGVTTTLGDRWLKTAPGPREVEISPTAQNLLGGSADQ